MKRVFLILAALLLVPLAHAAGLRYELRSLVERALAGERDAIARYEAYAAKADEEGYPGAAALFRAQMRAEQVHAKRFTRVLESNGHTVPPAAPAKPHVGTTAENLRAAASAEMGERDGTYREACETCRQHNANDLVTIFDQTRDAETEHANLCTAAARNLDALKQPKTYYVCNACGFTADIKLPLCALCRSKHAPEPVD